MASDNETSALITRAVKDLILKHCPNADLSCIDEIVISYVVGVVEDAAGGEAVDSEGVKELVAAYEPSFNEVSLEEITAWIDETIATIKQQRNKVQEQRAITLDSVVSSFTCQTKRVQKVSVTEPEEKERKTSSSSNLSTSSNSDIETLLELFPDACRIDAERCLSTTCGDLQTAIGIMLDMPVSTRISALDAVNKPVTAKLADDNTVKNTIINKYGFINKNDDDKEHKPVMPKWEGKKMVRYRDNKVVSLRGERYTEIKAEEPEVLKKATHLKAGKQYRFH